MYISRKNKQDKNFSLNEGIIDLIFLVLGIYINIFKAKLVKNIRKKWENYLQ